MVPGPPSRTCPSTDRTGSASVATRHQGSSFYTNPPNHQSSRQVSPGSLLIHKQTIWRVLQCRSAPRRNSTSCSSRRASSLRIVSRSSTTPPLHPSLPPERVKVVSFNRKPETNECSPLLTVYADWCGPCKQIAPLYETLSGSLSRPNLVTFVKINNDNQTELARQYSVTGLPTFLVFRDGKVIQKVQGANPVELKNVVQKLATEVESLGEGGSGSGLWMGAAVPKGYSDITDSIETRGCELLNADEDAGPVKVLFETSKPSALDKGKGTKKDYVQSGADDQLLLFIPFQGSIKLHTLQVGFSERETGDSVD